MAEGGLRSALAGVRFPEVPRGSSRQGRRHHGPAGIWKALPAGPGSARDSVALLLQILKAPWPTPALRAITGSRRLGPVAPHGPRPVALVVFYAAERALSALSHREAASIPVRQIAAAAARARASALGGGSSINLSVCIAFCWCPHVHSLRTSSAEPQSACHSATARSSALAARPLMGAVAGHEVAMWCESWYPPPHGHWILSFCAWAGKCRHSRVATAAEDLSVMYA